MVYPVGPETDQPRSASRRSRRNASAAARGSGAASERRVAQLGALEPDRVPRRRRRAARPTGRRTGRAPRGPRRPGETPYPARRPPASGALLERDVEVLRPQPDGRGVGALRRLVAQGAQHVPGERVERAERLRGLDVHGEGRRVETHGGQAGQRGGLGKRRQRRAPGRPGAVLDDEVRAVHAHAARRPGTPACRIRRPSPRARSRCRSPRRAPARRRARRRGAARRGSRRSPPAADAGSPESWRP